MAITREQALDCFRSDDLIGIGMEADALRRRLHHEGVVGYLVEQTLVCTADAQARTETLLSAERIGASDLFLQAPDGALSLRQVEELLRTLQAHAPGACISGLNATVINQIARQQGLPVETVLLTLRQAGLSALSGEDAHLLIDRYRAEAGQTLCDALTWLAVHRAAHRIGLPTSASLTFGMGESAEDRLLHLLALRDLQEETGGFISFTAVAHSPRQPAPTHRVLDEATATDYLTTLAVSRMLLDTVAHVAGTLTQGLKVLQMSLRFGADDAGPVASDRPATRTGGPLGGPLDGATEEELRRLIRDAGFQPARRNGVFSAFYLG